QGGLIRRANRTIGGLAVLVRQEPALREHVCSERGRRTPYRDGRDTRRHSIQAVSRRYRRYNKTAAMRIQTRYTGGIKRGHPKEIMMRIAFAAASVLILSGIASEPAKADPYPWCAQYGGGQNGGAANCYFRTIEQCRAAISGMGGWCMPNQFFDGRPV